MRVPVENLLVGDEIIQNKAVYTINKINIEYSKFRISCYDNIDNTEKEFIFDEGQFVPVYDESPTMPVKQFETVLAHLEKPPEPISAIQKLVRERLSQDNVSWHDALTRLDMTQEAIDAVDLDKYIIDPPVSQ